MGIFRHPMEIGQGHRGPWETFDAVVDTGSAYSWVPASALNRLGIIPLRKRPFETADGRLIMRDIGEAAARLDGEVLTTLVVFGDEGTIPILGAYTLEGFGLAADPLARRLIPSPGRA